MAIGTYRKARLASSLKTEYWRLAQLRTYARMHLPQKDKPPMRKSKKAGQNKIFSAISEEAEAQAEIASDEASLTEAQAIALAEAEAISATDEAISEAQTEIASDEAKQAEASLTKKAVLALQGSMFARFAKRLVSYGTYKVQATNQCHATSNGMAWHGQPDSLHMLPTCLVKDANNLRKLNSGDQGISKRNEKACFAISAHTKHLKPLIANTSDNTELTTMLGQALAKAISEAGLPLLSRSEASLPKWFAYYIPLASEAEADHFADVVEVATWKHVEALGFVNGVERSEASKALAEAETQAE